MEIIKYFNSVTFRGLTQQDVYSKIEKFEKDYDLIATHIKFDMKHLENLGIHKAYVKFDAK